MIHQLEVLKLKAIYWIKYQTAEEIIFQRVKQLEGYC